jgi:5'-3' exonuclease
MASVSYQQQSITLNTTKGAIILIDTSYYVFYRYYATYNWYRKQNQGYEPYETERIMDDPIFVDKYVKMFEKHILDVCKNNGTTRKDGSYNNLVFVKDCSRDQIWRHKFMDGYKATRDEKTKTFNKDVFVHTYQKVLPDLIAKYGFQTIGHRCLEADDIIAIITDRLLNLSQALILPQPLCITIITNDNDYIQLLNHPSLKQVGIETHAKLAIKNMQDKHIYERTGCSPEVYTEVKKILGDKSDNIPSITSKCGDKTALKLAMDRTSLEKLFASTPAAKKQYELNNLLIDFGCIPQDLKGEVVDRIIIVTS